MYTVALRIVAVAVAAVAQLIPLAYGLTVTTDFGSQAQTIAVCVAASVFIAAVAGGVLGASGVPKAWALVQGAPSALVSAGTTLVFLPAAVYGVLSFGVAGILLVAAPAAVTALSVAVPVISNAAGSRLRASRAAATAPAEIPRG